MGWRLPVRGLRGALLTLVAVLSTAALAISYTVQVIAVSDQEAALSISRDLLRDGYPTYVVRSTGAQGDVYRVRVGAFANRSAALRYAESMPEVGGSRPVPALAEAIPQGIMPLAPRLLWQYAWTNEDVRVLPWPAGLAVRVQRGDPLRQALYLVFQDGEERSFEAWAALPLAVLPEPTRPPELDVPMIDLTLPGPVDEEPSDPEPLDEEPDAEPDAEPGSLEPQPAEDEAPEDADVPPEAGGPAQTPDAVPPEREGAPAETTPLVRVGAVLADPADAEAEVGLVLLRDRWLWPATWEEDSDEVRRAFRASLLAVTARDVGLSEEEVDALAYYPAGEPPPAVVVLDLSDPSARDAGRVVGLGDPSDGMRPFGPPRVVPAEDEWVLPPWPDARIRPEHPPDEDDLVGPDWRVTGDDGFVRITLPDGATWRAGVGTPLWSDGTTVLAWDGEHLLLYDFVRR